MNKYLEAYKEANNLTPKHFLLTKIRKANKLVRQACEKAKKYDELKTPKKPRVEKVWWASNQYSNSHYCPECNEPLNKFKNNFCNKCGTKIDWSDK